MTFSSSLLKKSASVLIEPATCDILKLNCNTKSDAHNNDTGKFFARKKGVTDLLSIKTILGFVTSHKTCASSKLPFELPGVLPSRSISWVTQWKLILFRTPQAHRFSYFWIDFLLWVVLYQESAASNPEACIFQQDKLASRQRLVFCTLPSIAEHFVDWLKGFLGLWRYADWNFCYQ